MITASLATYKPRTKEIVWDAVESLKGVDYIFLNVNTIPALTKEEVQHIRDKASKYDNLILSFVKEDLGDLAKFIPLTNGWLESGTTHLICDDDLIYGEEYPKICEKLIKEKGCSLSFGGKVLKKKNRYKDFRTSFDTWIHAFKGGEETYIDLPLTAVTSLDPGMLKNVELNLEFKNKGDMLYSLWCREKGVKILSPKFGTEYFKYNEKMGNTETIWDTMKTEGEKSQAKILNKYFV